MLIFHIVMTILILKQKYFIQIGSVVFGMAKTAFTTIGFIYMSILEYHPWHNGLIHAVAMMALMNT